MFCFFLNACTQSPKISTSSFLATAYSKALSKMMFNSVLSPVPSSDHERESKKSEYAMHRSWGSVVCVCRCACLKKIKNENKNLEPVCSFRYLKDISWMGLRSHNKKPPTVNMYLLWELHYPSSVWRGEGMTDPQVFLSLSNTFVCLLL